HTSSVYFHMKTIDAGGQGEMPCQIAEPEKLLFYTNTEDLGPGTTGDPDSWRPAADVDFPLAPVPRSRVVAPAKLPDRDAFNVIPDDAVVPGLEPFTLRLL